MSLEIWDKVRTPPVDALKKIVGGRLQGMTDIKPIWRYKAMTDIFGPCGIGWRYEIDKQWLEPAGEQVVAFVNINLFVKDNGEWSHAIPGQGGSMFTAKEKAGPHTSDEAYKMATTDALSVACKMLGVGADIYMGYWDGSKYRDDPKPPADPKKNPTIKLTALDLAGYKARFDKFQTVEEANKWAEVYWSTKVMVDLTTEEVQKAASIYFDGVVKGLGAVGE